LQSIKTLRQKRDIELVGQYGKLKNNRGRSGHRRRILEERNKQGANDGGLPYCQVALGRKNKAITTIELP
jgi:hypothetical protein